jgi:hypothetical protein
MLNSNSVLDHILLNSNSVFNNLILFSNSIVVLIKNLAYL